MSSAAAGYSGTPLSANLGLKPGCELFALETPPGYARRLRCLLQSRLGTSQVTRAA